MVKKSQFLLKIYTLFNATFPQMNVQIQWLNIQKTAELNTLIDIDNSLVNNKNDKIPLTLAQQKVLNVKIQKLLILAMKEN